MKKILKNNSNFSSVDTSTTPVLSGMNPWFLTGFVDAEGSFSILVQHNNKFKTNWRVKAIFAIGLHKQDVSILKEIQSALGGVLVEFTNTVKILCSIE